MGRPASAGILLGIVAAAAAAFPTFAQLRIPPRPSAAAAARQGAEADENIVFPPDAGIINVRDYGAKGDGATDDTAAIQRALAEHPNQGAIIYLPNGTYLISDTLIWPHGDRGGWEEKNTILQGQSRRGTVIRLRDNCPNFADPAKPKALVWTGRKPAQRFRNALRNLTFDTGRGNPGAIGVQFMANNQGCVRHVTIRSGDGAGPIGLDLGYTDEQGPCLIQDVLVVGFDVGVSAKHAVDGFVMEHVTLQDQRQCALVNDGQCLAVRGLTVRGAVQAVRSKGLLVLLDADLAGSGAAAVQYSGGLFARNIKTSGYQKAIDGAKASADGPQVAEFVSHPPISLFPSPQRSLGLPVRETPAVPWDDMKNWANGAAGAEGKDITKSLQAAIDSGKTTVYIPRGSFRVSDTVTIRGAVRRLIGCEANIEVGPPVTDGARPVFRFADGAAPAVVVERMSTNFARGPFFFMEHASSRALVMASISVNFQQTGAYRNTGSGPLFIDDVVGADWRFKNQAVWARQFNVENKGTHITNDGGTLWILNLKTEQGGTLIETTGGGRTELLGGLCYSCSPAGPDPMFVINDSSASLAIAEVCFSGKPYETVVRETRSGQSRTLARSQAPGHIGGCLLPLFAGYSDSAKRPD